MNDHNHDNALDTPPVQMSSSADQGTTVFSNTPESTSSQNSTTMATPVTTELDLGTVSKESSPFDFSNEPIDVRDAIQGFDISVAQEETRAKIALYFTNFFLFMIFLAVVSPFVIYSVDKSIFPQPVDGAKDLLTVLSSVLAGPFGFIVGFYFKQDNDR